MDYDRWDEMTPQSRCCECRCCNYWRSRRISSVGGGVREIRFYRIVIVVLVFVTSLSLLALSLHCHWTNCILDEDDASSGDVTAEMTSSNDPGDADDAPMSLFRAKRESRGQSDPPSDVQTSSHRKRHPPKMKGRRMDLSEFRRKHKAKPYYGDVMKLVGNLCPPKMPSKGHRKKQLPRPTSLIATTTTMMTTTNETCPMRNVTIEGSLNQSSHGAREEFRVCGPKDTESNDDIDSEMKKHLNWMRNAKKRGVCVPMPIVVDLKPEKSTEDHDSGSTIVMVKRCALLYKPIESQEDVTPDCHSVKTDKRTIHFAGTGGNVRSYEIYDDVICRARMTSENNETYTPSKKHGKRCPWPFKKPSATLSHCSCRKKGKGSAGHLVYRSCQMIVKGAWRLQDKQQECVRLGRCLPPKCKKTRVYDAATGRCVAQQPPPTIPAAASHPIDVQRPTRTAQQEATKSPTDT